MSASPITIAKKRDEYGRANIAAYQNGREIVVLVTIPKRARESYPTPGTHFVNDRTTDTDIVWYPSQRAARAAFDALVAAHAGSAA